MDRKEAQKLAKELVDKMTIEEIASQLKYDSPEIERLGIPEYNWWNESLHGVARAGTATSFPQAIGLGATFDEELLYEVGDVISTEGRAKYNEYSKYGDRDIYKGLTFWAPNVNLFRDPRWGRGQETYGEDPYLISRLAVSFIKGVQGNSEHMKAAACAKHLAVHSGPEAMRHFFDAKVSLKDMWETYLPAFEACVKDAKVEAVMGAYNRTNGEPCCAHSYLMEDVLRGKWKFEGHYVSDCWAIRDFHENHKVTSSEEESAVLALNKGCDLNCGCTYRRIMSAYESGMISESVLHRAAERLFTTRFLLGMFEETEYDHLNYSDVEKPEHIKIANKASEESIVLLKNDSILPLDKSKIQTIGVIGPNADSRAALIGNYYGTSSRYVTVLEAIQDESGDDVRVLYSEGSHSFKSKPDFLSRENNRIAEAKAVANNSDVVVLVIGLDEILEGEEGDIGNQYASGDKNDIKFPECQQLLIDTIIATGKPLITCVMAGSAMDLVQLSEKSNAILQAWYPGARGGKAVSDIIFGNVSPSGKLPVTFYRNLDGFPDFTDYSMNNRTYRFIDKAPLYPFGYGLTYGRTVIESAEIEGTSSGEELSINGLKIHVSARNVGKMDTDDVLQIYVQAIGNQNEVKNPRLCAFKRVHYALGKIVDTDISIPAEAFTVVTNDGLRVPVREKVKVFVGFGQPDDRTAELLSQHWSVLFV